MRETVARLIVELRTACEAGAVRASTPLQLAPEDKLDLLRYLDEFHYWHSLDDERRCKRCSRIITGRQILVIERQGTRGKLHLQCPTVACISTPSDWVYADPILAAKLRTDFRPAASQAGLKLAAERAYDGVVRNVSRAKKAGRKHVASPRDLERQANPHSFRAVAARSSLLRSIATGLHAIRPVA